MPDVVAPLLNFVSTATVAVMAGAISYAAGKGMKGHEWDLNLLREKVALRQRLYAEFLAEADRQMLQSMKEKIGDKTFFYEITRKLSEIELLSSGDVCAAAKAICDHVVGSHAAEEKTEFLRIEASLHREREEGNCELRKVRRCPSGRALSCAGTTPAARFRHSASIANARGGGGHFTNSPGINGTPQQASLA